MGSAEGEFLSTDQREKVIPTKCSNGYINGYTKTTVPLQSYKMAGLQTRKGQQQGGRKLYSLMNMPVHPATRETCFALAKDVVSYVGYNGKVGKSGHPYAVTLRRTVDELSEKHRLVFQNMTNKLKVTKDNYDTLFLEVADQMFRDDSMNWGRLVTLYALGGRIGRFCVEENLGEESLHHLTNVIGEYVASHCGAWIDSKGGWAAFEQFFPKKMTTEDTLWSGLLATTALLGVGVLAVCSVR